MPRNAVQQMAVSSVWRAIGILGSSRFGIAADEFQAVGSG